MPLFLRRLRGVVIATLLWAFFWGILGLLLGLVLARTPIHVGEPLGRQDLPVLLAIVGVILGAGAGLLFAILVLVGERGRTIENLRGSRLALSGALAGAAVAIPVWGSWQAALVLAALAGLAGWLAARVAQRSHARHQTPTSSDQPT